MFSISLNAQLHFSEQGMEMGIDHYYQSAILMGGGAAFFDYNNDGLDDLWINGGNIPDKLLMNKGDGHYEDVSEKAGIASIVLGSLSVVTGDINNDHFRDVFVMTGNGDSNKLFLNEGNGQFMDISLSSAIGLDTAWTMSGALADINLDGYLDFYAGNYIEELAYLFDSLGNTIGFDHSCFTDFIYLNNGNETFTKLEEDFWSNQDGCVLASTFTDYDLDGDQDLMVANDFGAWIRPNRLFRNDHPDFMFEEVSNQLGADVGIYGMGIAIGDYDLDQDLDYYITNLGRNVLLENEGNSFVDRSTEAGVENTYYQGLNTVGWGTAFEDLNNDMYPDLLVANGYIPSTDFIEANPVNPNRVYINNRDGSFDDLSNIVGFSDAQMARGLACSDIDRDGDIDVLLMNINGLVIPGEEINIRMYQNELDEKNNWIQFSLEGTKNNFDAFGSFLKVFVGGEVLLKELNGGSSHASQNSSVLHFGLGTQSVVDSVLVYWPGGKYQSLYNPEINLRHHVIEDLDLYSSVFEHTFQNLSIFPNPAGDVLFIKNGALDLKFEIYGPMGQLNKSGQGRILQIHDLNPGLYYLKLSAEGQQQFHHFIKQ